MKIGNLSDVKTQLAQVKAAGVVTVTATTQGVPRVVSGLSVQKKNLSATQVQLTVSFTQNPGDPYFTTAELYLQLGNNPPSLIAQGASSPILAKVDRTSFPATLIVASTGNWGRTSVTNSPALGLSLV